MFNAGLSTTVAKTCNLDFLSFMQLLSNGLIFLCVKVTGVFINMFLFFSTFIIDLSKTNYCSVQCTTCITKPVLFIFFHSYSYCPMALCPFMNVTTLLMCLYLAPFLNIYNTKADLSKTNYCTIVQPKASLLIFFHL